MCLIGPPGPLRSNMEVLTHMWLIFYLKNTLFYLRLSVYDRTQVVRKYNISEEKNYQMFSYMLNFLVCV